MTVWTFSLELEPFVLLILPETVQFVSAMEFLPSMTSASELFAVSSAFIVPPPVVWMPPELSAVVVMVESEILTVVPVP